MEPKERVGVCSGPWWVRTQWARASQRGSVSCGGRWRRGSAGRARCAEETALVAEFDRGSVGELADLAEVVDDRGGDEEVRVEAGVQLAELPAELGDGDGVLDEAAEVGVVATARAGGAAQRGA